MVTLCMDKMAREPVRVDSEVLVVDRLRTKLAKLEETCMGRYEVREQRVLGSLTYCVNALEQLQSWALFAIFPPDECNSDTYIAFVELRLQCVMKPLQLFWQAVQKEQALKQQQIPSQQQLNESLNDPRAWVDREPIGEVRDRSHFTTGPSRSFNSSPRESPTSPRTPQQGHSLEDHHVSETQAAHDDRSPLRTRVDRITQKHIEEAHRIKRLILSKITKFRKDIRTVYRWGQGSLIDLNGVMDDALADEIYLMVRGKMARVLSAVSIYEETAEQVERSFMQQTDKREKHGSDGDSGVSSAPASNFSERSSDTLATEEEGFNPMDLQAIKLCLGDLGDSGSGYTPRGDPEELHPADGDSTSGSTPEPPNSPRPKGLVKHPKIMKDRLQNYALPSMFSKGFQTHALNSSW